MFSFVIDFVQPTNWTFRVFLSLQFSKSSDNNTMVSYRRTSDDFTEIHYCFRNHFRPSVRRRLESPENTAPVMVRRSVRWWRRSKSPSTESTHARSAARMRWSARVSESGRASVASESSPEVPGSTPQQQLPQSDQPFVVSVIWLKHSVFNTRECDPQSILS